MPVFRVKASAVMAAPAATIYAIIADYREGHPAILPPPYFSDLQVEAGGRGAGTRIRFTIRAFGSTRVSRARVEEPEPGRVLLETDEDTGTATSFIVEPLPDARTRVTFETEYQAPGLRGWIEALLVPGFLRKVYVAELQLLARRAAGAAGAAGQTPRG